MNAPSSTDVHRAVGAVAGTVAVAVCLATVLTGGGSTATAPAATPATTSATSSHIELRFGDERVTATLADTRAARQLAGMLPLQVTLRDPMGQAASGPLPAPIDTTGAPAVTDPTAGGIYYWPPSASITVFYDDLGHSVPPPGLVRLGTVDTGLEAVAAAGGRSTVQVAPLNDVDS